MEDQKKTLKPARLIFQSCNNTSTLDEISHLRDNNSVGVIALKQCSKVPIVLKALCLTSFKLAQFKAMHSSRWCNKTAVAGLVKNLFELYLNQSEHFWPHCQYQLFLANCAEEENPAQPLRNGSYLPSFLATISNSLSEYFSSKTSCTSASTSGIEETENSENLLTVGGPLVSWSKLPVDMLNTPLRGLEAKPGFPLGREESSHFRLRRRASWICSSITENVLEMFDKRRWLSSDGSSSSTYEMNTLSHRLDAD